MLIGSEIAYRDALSILYEVHVIGNHADRDKVLLKESCHVITPAVAKAPLWSGASQFAAGNTAVRPLSKRSNKASSDAGPELASSGSLVAMKSPQALIAPLKMGLAGLTSRHQTTGRVRVFATANTWRTQRPRGASGFGTESQ